MPSLGPHPTSRMSVRVTGEEVREGLLGTRWGGERPIQMLPQCQHRMQHTLPAWVNADVKIRGVGGHLGSVLLITVCGLHLNEKV